MFKMLFIFLFLLNLVAPAQAVDPKNCGRNIAEVINQQKKTKGQRRKEKIFEAKNKIIDDLSRQLDHMSEKSYGLKGKLRVKLSGDGKNLVIDEASFKKSKAKKNFLEKEKVLRALEPYAEELASLNNYKKFEPTPLARKQIEIWEKIERDGGEAIVTASGHKILERVKNNLEIRLKEKPLSLLDDEADVMVLNTKWSREVGLKLIEDISDILSSNREINFNELNNLMIRYMDTQIHFPTFMNETFERGAGQYIRTRDIFPTSLSEMRKEYLRPKENKLWYFRIKLFSPDSVGIRDLNDMGFYPFGHVEVTDRARVEILFDGNKTKIHALYESHDIFHVSENDQIIRLNISRFKKKLSQRNQQSGIKISFAEEDILKWGTKERERRYSSFRSMVKKESDKKVANALDLLWFEHFHEEARALSTKSLRAFLAEKSADNFLEVYKRIQNPRYYGFDPELAVLTPSDLQQAAQKMMDWLNR